MNFSYDGIVHEFVEITQNKGRYAVQDQLIYIG